MTRAEMVLKTVLRIMGVGALLALVAVLMPSSWMVVIHHWLGLGEMPITPIVEYLARCLSAFYAFFGALCLVLATDVPRYRLLVRFLALSLAVMGLVFTGIDVSAGMPAWWSICEGPPAIGMGMWMYYLAAPDKAKER